MWREAWDLLLENQLSLKQICEELALRGYRLRDGSPFVTNTANGEIRHAIQALSRTFNNWFYAGWVVVENEWARIAPKSVLGEWEPIVTTEEFERGLTILTRRRQKPIVRKKHFYLLQGILYLEADKGSLRKLTCSKPNANRKRGGVNYYCIPSSEVNFLCDKIDAQIPEHVQRVQLDPEVIPKIREAYSSNAGHFAMSKQREQETLKKTLERIQKKETNLWRAFTEHGMRALIYEKLAREYEDERSRVEFALKAIQQENRECIANLDAALAVISTIDERFAHQLPQRQREILLHMVERVIIDLGGKILRLELKPPFKYLQSLANGGQSNLAEGGEIPRKKSASKAKRTGNLPAGSLSLTFGDPGRIRTCDQVLKRHLRCHCATGP